jgi:hypothetical protein
VNKDLFSSNPDTAEDKGKAAFPYAADYRNNPELVRFRQQIVAKEQELQEMKDHWTGAMHLWQASLPVLSRLVFAARDRCNCGAGMAYDPVGPGVGPFVSPLNGYWQCSAQILGTADESIAHTPNLPFAFYEILSENQPSANGATTRP